ncbi:ZIP family zinc transporter [Nocardioides sp.]|uniref:ZIP family metal transporter n=1 Tax=Nocardioides sp. TaxID=35761 RepID=UPI002ED3333E
MAMWEAALWGLLGGSTLVIGAALGLRFRWPPQVIGWVMAFGAGVLIASVAYELVDDAAQMGTFKATIGGLAAGSATFFVGDLLIARAGAADRKRSDGPRGDGTTAGPVVAASGAALALGALLDGVPESAAVGVTIVQEGAPSAAFIAAVALSNLPEGLASATGMRASGRSVRHILGLWLGIAVLSAVAAGLGFALLDGASDGTIAFVMTYAAGAILCMLASTMLPEAAKDGGPVVGLVTAAGFLTSVLIDRL